MGWEPQVNLIHQNVLIGRRLEFDNLGDPAVGVVVGLRLKGWLPDQELVGEHAKTPQVNLDVMYA